MYKGLKNDQDVKALQEILKIEGLYNGGISGNFGRKTAKAVGKFQRKHNIRTEKYSPEGSSRSYYYVGPNTRTVLNELYSDDDD